MNDEILRDYLPDLDMNSNRLPERNFFFGILGTIKNDYLQQVISDAFSKRFQVDANQSAEDYIVIDQNWYEELIKHPYISRKPGKAIHLIKQRSKLIRKKKVLHKFDLSYRISNENEGKEEMKDSQYDVMKRQKINNEKIQNIFSYNSSNDNIQFNI